MVRYVPGLKIYCFPVHCQLLYPCARSTIHSSRQHLLHHRLLQLESPSATPASSNPPLDLLRCLLNRAATAPRWARHGTARLRGGAVPRAALPPLAHPAFSLFCYLRIHSALWLLASKSWNDEYAMRQSLSFFFFFLNYGTWIGLDFFSDLLYLWVESCDLLPASSQKYKLLCGSWLYRLGVVHIHVAFSARHVGIGSHRCSHIHARGLS